jgi:hypothetical protein
MNSKSEWPSVIRFVWMAGGVVALNETGENVQINAGMGGRSLCTLRISTFASLFEVLRQKGFSILGATFLRHPEELQGLRPPEFRAMSPSKGWLVWDLTQKWRQIAFAAGKGDRMPLMDVASRIASGFRYSQMRLHDLVRAYSIQLRGRLHESEAKEYQAFKDINSFEVYKTIHSLFWELAVLRDTLAEFAADSCFSRVGVRTMRELLKFLQQNPSPDPLADEILRAANQSPGGWLATFTYYRNFFTHVAPMEQAAGISSAVQDMRNLSSDFSVPQIYYALPRDIKDLTRKRSKGVLFDSLKELSAASSQRHQRTSEPDALDYLHGCLNQFAELALTLVARSPIVPRPIHIGPEDIIGGIKVKRESGIS